MNSGKKYAIDFAAMICLGLLIALIGTAVYSWFWSFDRPTAIANTGACVGMVLAALSARSAQGFDRWLVAISLFASFGFQVWSLAAASAAS